MTVPEFWDFAVSTYGQPGAAEAFLALQDELGADVNMVLFCLWLGARRQEIRPILDPALDLSDTWQAVAGPLRRARRHLKELMMEVTAAEMSTLHDRIAACERDAERHEIVSLAGMARSVGQPSETADPAECGRHNLERYFSALNISADLLGRAEVLRILKAAFAA